MIFFASSSARTGNARTTAAMTAAEYTRARIASPELRPFEPFQLNESPPSTGISFQCLEYWTGAIEKVAFHIEFAWQSTPGLRNLQCREPVDFATEHNHGPTLGSLASGLYRQSVA